MSSPVALIAGYRPLRRLGSGARCDVELGRDPGDGRLVALKVLRSAADADRFGAGVEALAAVRHPHLVALLDVGETDDGRGVAVLERLGPLSLATLLADRGALTAGEAVTVLAPVAAAVQQLHDAGVSHGAIGPAAVLFRADGAPAL
ncbi:MAG: protein kinase, partial [Microbacteriaceae bacterium]